MKAIRVKQYLRPSGRTTDVLALIPDELKEIADHLTLTCESLPSKKVLVSAHLKIRTDEDELTELADNGPGENSPTEALIRLLKRFEAIHKLTPLW